MAPRTPELVTSEIEREREKLALAVSHLRSDLRAATDVRAVVRSKLPRIVVATVVAGGAFAALRVLRHRREPSVWARFGRFSIVER